MNTRKSMTCRSAHCYLHVAHMAVFGALLVCCHPRCCAANPATSEHATLDTADVMANHDNLEKAAADAFVAVLEQAEVVKKLASVTHPHADTIGTSGAVVRLQAQAAGYRVELQLRRDLQEAARTLLARMETHRALTEAARAAAKRAAALQAAATTPLPESTAVTSTKVPERYSYYQVKKAATLANISALADVYNNSNLWRLLFESNRDKVNSADDIVPVGTVLVVPDIARERAFRFE